MFEEYILAIVAIAALALSVRIVQQYEKMLVFTLGKFSKTLEPGLNFVIPFIQRTITVDIRETTVDVRPQGILSKDNVPTTVDAVVYYKIFDASKAILAVQNYRLATELLAQSTLRTVIGQKELNDFMQNKEACGIEILKKLQPPTDVWGINITKVEIKNIEMPENLERAMAKEAEAIREKKARIIKSEAELEAAKKFKEAVLSLSAIGKSELEKQMKTKTQKSQGTSTKQGLV